MPSLGELFVELGVVGDVKPLEKAIGTMKEAVKQIDNEIKANQRLLKYLQDIKNARNASEKALIKENFVNETKKQKMLDEIDANQKALDAQKAVASSIAGVVTGITVFVGAVTGAAIALNKFTNDLVESNQAMLDLTRNTDIALDTFQKWGSIGKMLGVENADQQLASLNERLFELRLTGEGARGFQLAGINPMGQDAEGVLEQLRTRVKGLNDTSATYLLKQMGIDPTMLHMLRMERKEFEELGQTIKKYQLTPDQTKEIQRMNKQIQLAGIQLQYLKDKAILALMPYWVQFLQGVTKVADKFVNFVKGVKQGITWGAKLTKVVLGLVAGFAAWSATTAIVTKTIGLVTTAVKALQVAFLALTAHPIIAGLTLLAGALYLIADDISHYMNGGGSLIGVIINGLKDLDIDGILGAEMPEWLKALVKVIDFLNGNRSKRASEKIMDEAIKKIDPDAVKVKNKDGSYGYAEIPPGYGVPTGGAAPLNGYSGELPNLIHNNAVSPSNEQLINNNSSTSTTNNDNKVTMNIDIQTSQPAFDIQQQLNQARFAMV